MRIGLKYCGGCRARYNRLQVVERIKEQLGETVEFVSPDDPDVELILGVEGCDTACADLSPYGNRRVRIVTKEADVVTFIEEIREQLEG